MRGGVFFFFQEFSFHFHCFRGAALPCCAFSFVHTIVQHIKRGKKLPYLECVRTYVRTAVSERSGRNRPRREAHVASELFSPEAWRRDSWYYCQVASLQQQSS